MLYLRTGGNGSCKTLFTLRDVRDLQLKENRPVYFVEGRFEPKPILTQEFGWLPIAFKDWELCEEGAIILCDEVHYDLPRRSPSSAVPSHIAHLSEHRKRGMDFFLLTQHPMNIDEFVRRLVQAPGYHEHFKRIMGGTNSTKVLQWDAVNPQCEKDGSAKTAQVSTRGHPKEVYDWYVSASLHTAKVRIPKQVYTLVACLVALVAVVYFLYQKFKPAEKPAASKPVAAATADAISPSAPNQANERRPMTAGEYVASYRPRVPGLMHTAPAYDKLTEPKRVPVPAACVSMPSKGCKCYTQDATPYPTPESLCRDLVAHGGFLAFQPEGERQAQAVASAQPAVGPQAAQIASQATSGLVVIGSLPPSGLVAPAPVPPAPDPAQNTASAKR